MRDFSPFHELAMESRQGCMKLLRSKRQGWVPLSFSETNPAGFGQQFFQITSMDSVLLQPDTGQRLHQRIAGLSFRLPQKVIRPCHVR